MKSDIKKQWVETLRSGKIPQAIGTFATQDENGKLHTDGPHCVLGVLARDMGYDVTEYHKQGSLTIEMQNSAGIPCGSPDIVLTRDVRKKLEALRSVQVTNLLEYCDGRNENPQLWQLNDAGVPFSVLADLIEDQLSDD